MTMPSDFERLASGDVVLTCVVCQEEKTVHDQPVAGRDLRDWWEARGRRCTPCWSADARIPINIIEPKAHQPGHDTEHGAAEAVAESAKALRGQVLAILRNHPDGLTDDEGAAILGGDRLRFGRRRNELADAGFVRDSGYRRTTPAGRPAIVWIAL